jgi:hypothetical protein
MVTDNRPIRKRGGANRRDSWLITPAIPNTSSEVNRGGGTPKPVVTTPRVSALRAPQRPDLTFPLGGL